MTDRRLKRIAAEFRAGILDARQSALMCFAVCAPLQALLAVQGIDTALEEIHFAEVNHVFLRLSDGRILDPTADQFGLDPVYIGPLPLTYQLRQARLVQPLFGEDHGR